MMIKPIIDKVSSLPRLTDIFVWCDYIELRCLVHPDKRFSRSDITEVQEEMSDTQKDVEFQELEEEAEDVGMKVEDLADDDNFMHRSARQDRLHQKTARQFAHINFRANIYEDFYPFELDDEWQSITLKDDLNDWQKLYIQLLISSVLRYCPSTRRKDVTDPFEEISVEIFKCIMPGWEVHPFGKNTAQRYTGHLYDKLQNLAEDVRGTLVAQRHNFHDNDRGDGGLDIVAWHPMEDGRSLVPMAFAQCGCTASDFDIKMLEASPAKLGAHLHVPHDWACYYFMPQSMHSERNWFRYSDFGKSIVVDRLRILRLARRYNLDPESLVNHAAVEEAKSLEYT